MFHHYANIPYASARVYMMVVVMARTLVYTHMCVSVIVCARARACVLACVCGVRACVHERNRECLCVFVWRACACMCRLHCVGAYFGKCVQVHVSCLRTIPL